jgi:hypothetical protein
MTGEYSGLEQSRFIGVEAARHRYELQPPIPTLFDSVIEQQLAERGIAAIEMPVTPGDFETLLEGYAVCLGECPDQLLATFHHVDSRFGNEAGQVRKERKYNASLQQQTQDPKDLFHFNEYASRRWGEEFADAPQVLKDFLANGQEIHQALITVANQQFNALTQTHPGIATAHFPYPPGSPHSSMSFMRLLRYDGYIVDDSLAELAKAHYDISGATIQAYADAPGFWGTTEGPKSDHIPYDTDEGQAFFFLGQGYRRLYGDKRLFSPLYHGVDRIVPAGASYVPERHAIVLFIDAPFINYGVQKNDTLPELRDDTEGYRAVA